MHTINQARKIRPEIFQDYAGKHIHEILNAYSRKQNQNELINVKPIREKLHKKKFEIPLGHYLQIAVKNVDMNPKCQRNGDGTDFAWSADNLDNLIHTIYDKVDAELLFHIIMYTPENKSLKRSNDILYDYMLCDGQHKTKCLLAFVMGCPILKNNKKFIQNLKKSIKVNDHKIMRKNFYIVYLFNIKKLVRIL